MSLLDLKLILRRDLRTKWRISELASRLIRNQLPYGVAGSSPVSSAERQMGCAVCLFLLALIVQTAGRIGWPDLGGACFQEHSRIPRVDFAYLLSALAVRIKRCHCGSVLNRR